MALCLFLVLVATHDSKSTDTALNSKDRRTALTSIQDALSKSLSLQCAFTDEKGKKTKTYIKAGAVRTDFTGTKPEDTGSMIMKDKKLYTWTNANKEGFMMTVPDITPGQTNIPGSATGDANRSQQATDVLTALDKFKDSCKPATVADNLFVPIRHQVHRLLTNDETVHTTNWWSNK